MHIHAYIHVHTQNNHPVNKQAGELNRQFSDEEIQITNQYF